MPAIYCKECKYIMMNDKKRTFEVRSKQWIDDFVEIHSINYADAQYYRYLAPASVYKNCVVKFITALYYGYFHNAYDNKSVLIERSIDLFMVVITSLPLSLFLHKQTPYLAYLYKLIHNPVNIKLYFNNLLIKRDLNNISTIKNCIYYMIKKASDYDRNRYKEYMYFNEASPNDVTSCYNSKHYTIIQIKKW